MSKTEKATAFPDSLVSETASEVDSRLRELEKNIAVAREFIKLADESYTELRHKWNLLQQEANNKTNNEAKVHSTHSQIQSSAKPPRKAHPQIREKDATTAKETGASLEGSATTLQPDKHPSKKTGHRTGTGAPDQPLTPTDTANADGSRADEHQKRNKKSSHK